MGVLDRVEFVINPSSAKGVVPIPASKSHTIRALFFAALADGRSRIINPLDSSDGRSALKAVQAMGAKVEIKGDEWIVDGFGGKPKPVNDTIDVGNSGTTARFIISMAALADRPITITGDASTSSRPMEPLLDALKNLGATVTSTDGKLPVTVCGPIEGGETSVDGTTSQYLSSLLAHTPSALGDTVITCDHLNEKPYVDMTARWLDKLGIEYKRDGYKKFEIKGHQNYPAFEERIASDFSSAAFFACLGAIPGNNVTLLGLDMDDSQGDKAIFSYLEKMGTKITYAQNSILVEGDTLNGAMIDLNATPDALPAMAALAALAKGATHLVNVPQARIKETDRIAVMAGELSKMGIRCEEKPDGLTIHSGTPQGARLKGHGDHRIVMSLAILASAAKGETTIDTAESVDVTFPGYADLFRSVEGKIETV